MRVGRRAALRLPTGSRSWYPRSLAGVEDASTAAAAATAPAAAAVAAAAAAAAGAMAVSNPAENGLNVNDKYSGRLPEANIFSC